MGLMGNYCDGHWLVARVIMSLQGQNNLMPMCNKPARQQTTVWGSYSAYYNIRLQEQNNETLFSFLAEKNTNPFSPPSSF